VEVQSGSDSEGTVDIETIAATPAAAPAAAPPAEFPAAGHDDDAFSGASLDGSAMSTFVGGSAAASHQLAVVAPVSAHTAADFHAQPLEASQGAASGVSSGDGDGRDGGATNGEGLRPPPLAAMIGRWWTTRRNVRFEKLAWQGGPLAWEARLQLPCWLVRICSACARGFVKELRFWFVLRQQDLQMAEHRPAQHEVVSCSRIKFTLWSFGISLCHCSKPYLNHI